MSILAKSLAAMLGSAMALGLFWVVCWYFGWEPPTWAWFIVGWIGHNDFYDAMTYKRESF